MTYECPVCRVAWAPYQAKDGACPACATGTIRRPGLPMTTGAMELYRKIVHERADEQRAIEHAEVVREAFDRHCAARDRETIQRFASWLDGVRPDAFAA